MLLAEWSEQRRARESAQQKNREIEREKKNLGKRVLALQSCVSNHLRELLSLLSSTAVRRRRLSCLLTGS
eukprot:8530572-Pyramimonas_sp.AAC.1